MTLYDIELENIKSTVAADRNIIESIPGVVGTGITHTAITGIGGGYHLVVYLEYFDLTLVDQIIQAVGGLSISGIVHTRDYVPVTFEVTGAWHVLPTCGCTQKEGTFGSRYRPVQGGASISNSNICNAAADVCYTGTLAGFPLDSSGKPVLLSNNHVIAIDFSKPDFYTGKRGDPIIQPGFRDGGNSDTDAIASLEKWVRVMMDGSDNKVDCGYAVINGEIAVSDANLCGAVTGKKSVDPVVGMAVKKAGRTTGCTTGKIKAVNVSGNVRYSTGTAYFVDQVNTSLNLNSGDSGSLILTDQDEPVALLFSSGPQNIIKNVENALGVLFGGAEGCASLGCGFSLEVEEKVI